jgi:hypothetical protein
MFVMLKRPTNGEQNHKFFIVSLDPAFCHSLKYFLLLFATIYQMAVSKDDQLKDLLSSDQFSVAAYLNLALNDEDDQQQRMAELALQLQMQTQSCHEEIGKIGAELQAILPRCSADIGRVGVGLEGLRIDAASLLESTAMETSEGVSSSLETLGILHALEANLQRSKEILTAAATWDTTLSSIAPLLAQQNISEAVNALAQLENGERALRGMPNPEEREEAIAKVRQQVSTMLQPQLKHALANMSTRLAPLQQCVTLYSKLNKMDSLKEEYIRNRPSGLHKSWFDYKMVYDEQDTDKAASEITTWLSLWYDSVLSLISEERRQSTAIFGTAMVPGILVKVLWECFRPLLSSFQSRLENIYSLDPAKPNKGSFDSICTLYESTLQFLSLVYESVANCWIDITESGTVPEDDGLKLYRDLTNIFIQVLAPFSAYQKNLPNLEAHYMAGHTEPVAKQIQQAAMAVSSSDFESLQHATYNLQNMAHFIFPLAERSLGRFELLNAGYGPTKTLSTIDHVLGNHADELTMAVKSLSAAMAADEKQLVTSYDDSHVMCALGALKVAGTFRRNLKALERKTFDRLRLLRERIETHGSREKGIGDTAGSSSSKKAFALPDSLSLVEIDSIVTKAVCGENEGLTTAATALQRLIDAEDNAGRLFVEAEEATQRLMKSCQLFIHDMCSSIPRQYIAEMSSMSSWREGSESATDTSYGILPQPYINHIGEHLLALVQGLEPFTSDREALSLANDAMLGLRDIALEPWREFILGAGYVVESSTSTWSPGSNVVKEIMEGTCFIGVTLGSAPIDDDAEAGTDEQTSEEAVKTAFCDSWLDVVGLSVTGRLLDRIVHIPSLSLKGCDHLSADLNYLVNVFSALGITGHPHPLLGHIAVVAAMDVTALNEQIHARDRSDTVGGFLYVLEMHVAKLRGII